MRGFSIAGVMLWAATAAAQPLTLFDGTFNDADWSLAVVVNTSGITPTAFQGVGNGNPGMSRVTLLGAGGANGSTVETASFRLGFSYNPSVQGAVSGISFRGDHMLGPNAGAVSGTFAFALRQGGVVYRTDPTVFPSLLSWQALTASGLGPLTRVSPSGPALPNFTTGGPLDFGFYVGFLLPSGGGGAEGVAVDNFDLVITPVPEPSSLGLAVLAGVAGFARWRHRR
jgi:hypothetical protein